MYVLFIISWFRYVQNICSSSFCKKTMHHRIQIDCIWTMWEELTFPIKSAILNNLFFPHFCFDAVANPRKFNLICRGTQTFNTSHLFRTQTVSYFYWEKPTIRKFTNITATITMKPTTKSRSLPLRVYCITRACT